MMAVFLLFIIYTLSKAAFPPGLNHAAHGYNFMEGNPLQKNQDPGWKKQVFNFTNNGGGQCFKPYSCPSNVDAELSISKSCTSEQDPIFGKFQGPKQYQLQFPQIINIDGENDDKGGSFEGSDWYQMVIDDTKNHDYIFISNYFTCTYYKIQTGEKPKINAEFYNEIKNNMPTQYNSATKPYFVNFFDIYGSHYVYQAVFGCIQGQLSKMTASNYSQFASSNLDIEYASTFSVWSKNISEKVQGDAFRNACIDQYNFTRGGTIPDHNYTGWQSNCTKNSIPIQFNLKTIAYGLQAPAFSNIHDIGDKRSALTSATNDYCNTYRRNHSDSEMIFNCSNNGWPNDGTMPKTSIILGFYAEKANGWDEPINLYTGDRSCKSADISQKAFEVINPADPAQNISIYMCLVKNYNSKDPFNYFGGMYSNGSLPVKNYFTGKKSCPDGFEDYMFMNCDENDGSQCINPHICYNSSVSLKKSIIGGFYTEATYTKDNNKCEANNPYTGERSCPHNFTPYTLATTYWGDHPGYYCTMKICYSNNAIYEFYG
eukprot:428399_1